MDSVSADHSIFRFSCNRAGAKDSIAYLSHPHLARETEPKWYCARTDHDLPMNSRRLDIDYDGHLTAPDRI